MDRRVSELADRLDAIAEQLTEVSVDILHQAVSEGATTRPREDKVLSQARRAVEKAARLLHSAGDSSEAELS